MKPQISLSQMLYMFSTETAHGIARIGPLFKKMKVTRN